MLAYHFLNSLWAAQVTLPSKGFNAAIRCSMFFKYKIKKKRK